MFTKRLYHFQPFYMWVFPFIHSFASTFWLWFYHFHNNRVMGTFLMVQWLRLFTFHCRGVQVQSLVGELISHMPHCAVKKQPKTLQMHFHFPNRITEFLWQLSKCCMCSLVICMFCHKCLFKSLAHLFIGMLMFLLLNVIVWLCVFFNQYMICKYSLSLYLIFPFS